MVYIYIYIYIQREREVHTFIVHIDIDIDIQIQIQIYIYIHIHIHIHIHLHTYTYISSACRRLCEEAALPSELRTDHKVLYYIILQYTILHKYNILEYTRICQIIYLYSRLIYCTGSSSRKLVRKEISIKDNQKKKENIT